MGLKFIQHAAHLTPLEALRSARIEARRAEVNASRVDFFTLVRGDNV